MSTVTRPSGVTNETPAALIQVERLINQVRQSAVKLRQFDGDQLGALDRADRDELCSWLDLLDEASQIVVDELVYLRGYQ